MKFMERKGPGSLSTIVSSRVFAWLLRDVLKCGTCSENKTLPRLAFNVPAEMRHELVRGAFSGDGAVTKLQGGKNLMLEYATVSKPLADGLALLLQSLGVIVSIRMRMMNKSKHLAYILRVSGYSQIDALKYAFGEKYRAKIEDTLAGYERHIKQRGFLRQGPYAALTVLAVEYRDVDTTVYSLETSTGTLIASSGLICHNCFPKDVKALAALGRSAGYEMKIADAVLEVNEAQTASCIERIKRLVPELEGKTVAVLGLSFKPETDDMREAPSLKVIADLLASGAKVRAYDPAAMLVARQMMPDVEYCEDEYTAARDSHALVVLTEWNQFRSLDFERLKQEMKELNIIDLRNIYEPEAVREAGFNYVAVGRL
jgi:UDPglucose 6-dehydrogenase